MSPTKTLPVYHCDKHGAITEVLTYTIQDDVGIERKAWCMQCIEEHWKELGLLPCSIIGVKQVSLPLLLERDDHARRMH